MKTDRRLITVEALPINRCPYCDSPPCLFANPTTAGTMLSSGISFGVEYVCGHWVRTRCDTHYPCAANN